MARQKRPILRTPFTSDASTPVPGIFWGPVFVDDKGHPYSPGYIGNTFSKNAWDAVQIAIPLPFMTGVLQQLNVDRTPGLCEVDVRRGRDIDRKKSAGSDGQRLTFKGINNADVDIRITIWTPEQLDVLSALWNVLQPKAGKGTPSAFDVKHPQFEINGVKSLCFVDSIGMTDGHTSKTKIFTIKAIEYFPPGSKSAVTTLKKAEARSNVLQSQYPKPGENPENLGPK